MEQSDSPRPSRQLKPRRKRALKAAAPPSALPVRLDGSPRNPEDYDWVPVLRKRRADGWSPTKQRMFIEALAQTGSVEMAARSVDMSVRCCYKLRHAPGSEGFCAAWSAAIDVASKKLIDTAFERAIVGSDEPVFDREGNVVGRRHRQSDKLLMFLLRAYMPERFRYAALNARHPSEPPPITLAPMATAFEQLGPPQPAEPHKLMPPERLETALIVADINPGKLPHWIPDVDPEREFMERTNPMPMGEEFERMLEQAKRGDGAPPITDEEWAAFMKDRGWDKRPRLNDLS